MGRYVIAGASGGLGRACGESLAAKGHAVVLFGRREDRMASASLADGVRGIVCDVTDETQVDEGVSEAVDLMGGVDGCLYTAVACDLAPIEGHTSAMWTRMLSTNVLGAFTVTRALLKPLTASNGRAVYMSSPSGRASDPWAGLAGYASSKAALEKMVDAWRLEHPNVGFTIFTLTGSGGGDGEAMSEFPRDWDPGVAGQYYPEWEKRGHVGNPRIDGSDLAAIAEMVLGAGPTVGIDRVEVSGRLSVF